MLWLLLLHISAVVCWCGSLLYLPALIASTTASQQTTTEQQRHVAVVHIIYKLFTTPAALVAITSGTAIFLVGEIVDSWLILKLTLVVALVMCHALIGWIIVLMQKAFYSYLTLLCALIGGGVVMLILIIIGVVLTKPF
jgi:protoporphyrinogen IX oxidase